MHIQFKLREAEYFLDRMTHLQHNRTEFIFNLDAFLAAARAVMSFIRNQVKCTPRQDWYDCLLRQYDTLKFFKRQRDITLHTRQVEPRGAAELGVRETISVSLSNFSIRLLPVNEERNVIENADLSQDRATEEKAERPGTPKASGGSVKFQFTFGDWEGPEDVITLGRRHLDELREVVEAGVTKGYLTPDK